MKFALLGIDDATLALARAVAADPRHTLVGSCEIDAANDSAARATLLASNLAGRTITAWESLLDEHIAEAILIARDRDADRRGDQLRRLVQAGSTLVVSHPLCDSMICYEVDMARQESHSPLMAYLPDRWHPAVAELIGWLEPPVASDGPSEPASALGPVEQCVFVRPLADRSKASVAAAFARDVDLIRALAGDVTRLAAYGPADTAAAYATLQVQLTTARMPTVRWQVVPADEQSAPQLTIAAARGKVVLTLDEREEPWTLNRTGSDPRTLSYADWNPAVVALERLSLLKQRESAAAAGWLDAIRSIELAETIERSLRRACAVELKVEETSEESNFKGTMAAVGCCLLLLVTFIAFVVGTANGIKGLVGWPAALLDHWPKLLLLSLGLFLALQFLLGVTRPRSPRQPEP